MDVEAFSSQEIVPTPVADGMKRKRKGKVQVSDIFTGEVKFDSQITKDVYDQIRKKDMVFEEIVDFQSIDHATLREAMTYAGLFKYLTTIKTLSVQVDEVIQFYTNLSYERKGECARLHSHVNNEEITLKEINIATWCNLPNTGLNIEMCTDLESLPVQCSEEEFWSTLSEGYDPRDDKELTLTKLNVLASMIVRIIHKNIYPRAGKPLKAHFQVLAATFCILKRYQVNWCGLVMHAMSRCLSEPEASLFFPRMISKLLSPKRFNIPLQPAKICKMIRLEACSFRSVYLNCYQNFDPNSPKCVQNYTNIKQRLKEANDHLLSLSMPMDKYLTRLEQEETKCLKINEKFLHIISRLDKVESSITKIMENIDLLLHKEVINQGPYAVEVKQALATPSDFVGPPARTPPSP